MKKLPFHIISGFLGSGKTTFLKRIIEQEASGKKIGIIQNEFAPANIDGVELKESDAHFDLLEINNGSVFCVCLLGDFVRSLESFIEKHKPDVVILEASGLSDTTSISEVLVAGSLNEKMYLASNWCIVDARNFGRVGLMKQRVMHQLRMADVTVINKMDLMEGSEDQIVEEIKKINPFTRIKTSTYCDIDFELGDEAMDKYYFTSVTAMPRPDVNSMVLKTSKKPGRAALLTFLEYWAPKAYRIKGFVNVIENVTLAVQCTMGTVEIQEVESGYHPTELIALSDQFTLKDWYRSYKALDRL